MDIISAWYLILILGLIMMKLILFWGQGEESGLAKSDIETERRLSLCQMKETQVTSWGFEVHSLGMIGNCLADAQVLDFKVNNSDQALGWTLHNGVKIRAVFPAE